MVAVNRDWKTFEKRWGASRFEKFLFWSVVIHVLVGVLVMLPVHLARQERKALLEEQERLAAQQEKKKEEAVEEAEEEIEELLKEELAVEQLKEFYEGLIADLMDEEEAEHYWDELLEELDTELEELADLLADLENLDPLEAEDLLQDLRASLLDKLTEMLAGEQQTSLMEEILAQARKLAEELAKLYQDELAKRVGRPIGDNLKKTLEKEESTALAKLEQAERELDYALNDLKHAEELLKDTKERLGEHEEATETAKGARDDEAAEGARQRAKKEKGPLDIAARSLDRSRSRMKKAADNVAWHLPRAKGFIDKAEAEQASPAREGAAAAAQEAAKGDPGKAKAHADASLAKTRETEEALERVKEAVGLRIAAEMTNRLSREAGEHAREAETLAKERNAAEKSGDFKEMAEVTRHTASSAGKVEKTEGGLDRLDEKLDAVGEKGKGIPKKDYGPPIDAAKGELAEGRESLLFQAPERAQSDFKDASEKLRKLAGEIKKAQDKLGFGEESVGKAVLREVDDLRKGKLTEHVQKEFDQLYREKAVPAIMAKVGESVDKRLRAESVFNEAFKQELDRELEKIFGENVLEKVQAGEQFAESAGEKLPRPEGEKREDDEAEAHEEGGKPEEAEETGEHHAGAEKEHGVGENSEAPVSERVTEVVGGAEKASIQHADRHLPGVVASGIRRSGAHLLDGGNEEEHGEGHGPLLARLNNLKGQLGSGRKGFLDRPGAEGIAAARRRHIGRKGSLSKFRRLSDIDVEAYRQIVARLKDRGQITGKGYDLRGAEGDVSAAEDEKGIQPAMVCVQDPPSKKDEAVPDKERKIAAPEFKTSRFTGIPFLPEDAITIDGDLTDWKDLPPMILDPIKKGPRAPSVKPDKQKGWVAYCSKGILVAAEVTDTTGKIENHVPIPAFWWNDCVEIFLDMLNSKFSKRGEQHTHQFFAFPFGHKDHPEVAGYEAFIDPSGDSDHAKRIAFSQDVMPRAGKKTEQGWNVEYLIPKKLLRLGEIKPGLIVGLNFQIDTGSDLYFYWTCAKKIISSLHPNTWGDVQFLGSDAKIDILEAEGEETAHSILPGDPARIRVIDPDMNLSDLKKDKVALTLRTDGGDIETLVLEETERKTGVFASSVATGLNVGSNKAGTLEVFEGETVTAEYIDQAQAYGERNVSIKAEFRVSSLGTKIASE